MKDLIKSVIRNFIRKPATNLINLLGLAVSMTLVIIISIYCYSELSTDHFHKESRQVYLYRLSDNGINSPGILKDNIDIKIPDVEATVRIGGTWEAPVFQTDYNKPVTSDLIFADEDFFRQVVQ